MITGKLLMDDFALIVLKQGDIERPLTASQLCTVLDSTHTMILNQAHVAPCQHVGSRYRKEGEEQDFCGVCSRKVEDDWRESLASA